MRSEIGMVVIAGLAAGYCCCATAAEQEFQITPRIGSGSIKLDQGTTTIDVANQAEVKETSFDVGVALGYVTPIGVILEVGAQAQSNFTLGGAADRLAFSEQFIAAGYQLEFGNGFRLTPTVGRTRWRLSTKEGLFANRGPELKESIEGYEDFWDLSLTKTVMDWMSMGARYRSTEYDFGRVNSTMFVVTFGFR
jgi:hypothetical protein